MYKKNFRKQKKIYKRNDIKNQRMIDGVKKKDLSNLKEAKDRSARDELQTRFHARKENREKKTKNRFGRREQSKKLNNLSEKISDKNTRANKDKQNAHEDLPPSKAKEKRPKSIKELILLIYNTNVAIIIAFI